MLPTKRISEIVTIVKFEFNNFNQIFVERCLFYKIVSFFKHLFIDTSPCYLKFGTSQYSGANVSRIFRVFYCIFLEVNISIKYAVTFLMAFSVNYGGRYFRNRQCLVRIPITKPIRNLLYSDNHLWLDLLEGVLLRSFDNIFLQYLTSFDLLSNSLRVQNIATALRRK